MISKDSFYPSQMLTLLSPLAKNKISPGICVIQRATEMGKNSLQNEPLSF